MVYVICDKESGIITDFSTDVQRREEDPGMFYDAISCTYYPDDMSVYYELEDVPKYVRIGDWKYTEEDGFTRAYDFSQLRELRMNQMKRMNDMTKALGVYDDVNTANNMLLCAVLAQQLYR